MFHRLSRFDGFPDNPDNTIVPAQNRRDGGRERRMGEGERERGGNLVVLDGSQSGLLAIDNWRCGNDFR